MDAKRSARFLLIYPPPATPAMPSLRLARAVAWFIAASLPVAVWDANLAMHASDGGHPADRWHGVRRDDASGLVPFLRWADAVDWTAEPASASPPPAAEWARSTHLSGAGRVLDPQGAGSPTGILLICESEAQRVPAGILADRIRAELRNAAAVTLVPPAAVNRRPLTDRLAEAVGGKTPTAAPHADFSLTPPSAYASPEALLPFALRRPTDGAMRDPQRLLETLVRRSAQYAARLLFAIDDIDSSRLAAFVAAVDAHLPGCRLSLNVPLAADAVLPADSSPVARICWRLTGGALELDPLLRASRAGIWNHLILDGASVTPDNCRRAALQPNIVHSWEVSAHDPLSAAAVYTEVRPLPDRPLWQRVRDPVMQFLLAVRLGKDRLLRLRVDAAGRRIWAVGDDLSYHFCVPNDLPAGYLDEICAMVAAGGTVAATHVRSNLERAYLIGYVLEKGVIVGNSSLKHPRPEYIDNVRRQSGLDLTGFVERGYTSVRPEYRGLGIGTRLLAGLTERAGDRPIFSVISEDNAATQTIARRNRTRKVATYFSDKAGKPVGIWMPEGTAAPKAT